MDTPKVVNGWTIYAHPLFVSQYQALVEQVEKAQQKAPEQYQKKNITKRLYAIHKLAYEIIPKDPTIPEYRLGHTLGKQYKHWFRAKFFQQYRLFFRYHQESKIIVLGWVNDSNSKRAFGSKTDAYRVFEKMLNNGNPPDDWATLLKECRKK